MLYVVKTSHPDSDSFTLTNTVLPLISKEPLQKKRFDCNDPKELEKFFLDTQVISFLPKEKTVYLLSGLKLTESDGKKLLAAAEAEDIVLISPAGKSLPKSSQVKEFITPIKSQQVKTFIANEIKDLTLPSWLSVQKILEKTSILDDMGNVYHSPLQAVILVKQVSLLKDSPELLKALFAEDSNFVSQWAILEKLFSTPVERMEYFEQLATVYDPYELLNMIKHNLLLAIPIAEALQSRMDTDSIAKTLKKHPFYIKNIASTISKFSITQSNALALLSRIIRVEEKVKSGELDDPSIGIDTVLATVRH